MKEPRKVEHIHIDATNKFQNSVELGSSSKFGVIKAYVPEDNLELAKKIIDNQIEILRYAREQYKEKIIKADRSEVQVD